MNNYDEFQQGIIGALLLYDDIRPSLISKLRKSDFTDEPANEVFEEIVKDPQADKIVIIKNLSGEAKQYVLNACELAPLRSIAEETVSRFIEHSVGKWILEQTQTLAFSPSVSIEELKGIIDRAQERTEVVTDNSEKYLSEFFTKLETTPTGFEKLDKLLNGGFIEGTISTIGARPSTGKTTFAINILKSCLDFKSVFFSLEMSGRMIYDRIVSDMLEIEYGKVHRHKLSDFEFEKVKKLLNVYRNLTVIDNMYDVEQITAYVYANKPKLVVIDFVQIITTQKKFVDNRQRIDFISQRLKKCAKETKCCFIVLSQITRNGKDSPTMSDLKESGGLEQDSDYIMLLHRPYVNSKDEKETSPSETKLIVDKNKFGNTGVIDFNFNGMFQRFSENTDISEKIARPISGAININDDLPF